MFEWWPENSFQNDSVPKLQANFLFQQINYVTECVKAAGVEVKAIICDGNRVNQAFFRMYKTIPDKPQLSVDGVYVLYDYVPLLKSIRN